MKRIGFTVLAMVAVGCAPPAPPPPAPPSSVVTDSIKTGFDIGKNFITQAAEQMAEADFAFKPTGVAAEVRSFGQLVGHVANANYLFCSMVSGEAGPGVDIEQTATSKADLTKALGEAFAFCDRAFGSVNDQTGADPLRVDFLNADLTKLGVLAFNNAHNMEHYGNIVTYMRAKGMVPPSSQSQGGN